MYKGFLGEQKTLKVRLPIKLSNRLDDYSTMGVKKAAVMRALIEMGLKQADKMSKAKFMKLVHEFKTGYAESVK